MQLFRNTAIINGSANFKRPNIVAKLPVRFIIINYIIISLNYLEWLKVSKIRINLQKDLSILREKLVRHRYI